MTTVLFVDDEPNILHALQRVMRRADVTVLTTTDPLEAIGWVKSQPVAVVVSDQRMPDMAGADLLEAIREYSPQTVRMILTGYADVQAAVDAINRGGAHRYLAKPWDDAVLMDTVMEAVRLYRLEE